MTVTSADALGNTSTAARTLTVPAPPAPPVSTPTKAALARAAARAQVKNGKALLKLTCPASGLCEGQVVLSARTKKAAKGHSKKKQAHTQSVTIGTASFQLAAGAHATVAVELDAKGLAALGAAGKRGLEASLGGTGIKPGPVVLKATPARHRTHRHR